VVEPHDVGHDLGRKAEVSARVSGPSRRSGRWRGIDPKVQLPPPAPRPTAVLLHQPLAGAAQLQPCAVHQQVHGLTPRARSRYLQDAGTSTDGRVIGHGEIEAERPCQVRAWRGRPRPPSGAPAWVTGTHGRNYRHEDGSDQRVKQRLAARRPIRATPHD
jgi:hypothetical protein